MPKAIIAVLLLIRCIGVPECSAQNGCTDPAAINYDTAAVQNDGSCTYPYTRAPCTLKAVLPAVLSETSGLIYTGGKLWTHNDSDHLPEIYSIDTATGMILQTVRVDNYTNIDWEDITADEDFIYIGDHGNNKGTRNNLRIIRIARSDIGTGTFVHVNATAIQFTYGDQASYTPGQHHNFDCEALISVRDSLYLFTKNRGDLKTKVYKIGKTPGTFRIYPVDSFNVNGLITGADYNEATNEIVLIGYHSDHTHSFIWILNDYNGGRFFSGNKRRIEIGQANEWQTEGIAYRNTNSFYISNESTAQNSASLLTCDKAWQPLPVSDKPMQRSKINVYPNPCSEIVHIDGMVEGKTRLLGLANSFLREFSSGQEISLKGLMPGSYILRIYSKTGEIIHQERIIKIE